MPIKSHLTVTISVFLLLALLAGGCGPQSRSLAQNTVAAVLRGITGTIKTGKTIAASSVNVSAGGGTITVNKPGDPLDGMQITIPEGAYSSSRQFKLTYALIENQTFGVNFNPITPMITIDNGGGYADEIIEVKIPVHVPDGSFAMGFIYDNATKTLEGMPLIAEDVDSVTIGTRHFTDFVISMIPIANLKNDIDSHFRPGVDDWEFPNACSCIAPLGQCAGNALSALWYFCNQPDGKGVTLFGRYDNNGNSPKTPNLWQDDSLGYRFASVVQVDMNWFGDEVKFWKQVNDRHELTWNLFAYAMLLTGEPQFVAMRSRSGGGHAMIVYRIKDGELYVADPNFRGNTERRIKYSNGNFTPYSSGRNTQEIESGKGRQYETIQYWGKSTIIDIGKIAMRWTELKNKTIGNDKFPQYKIVFRNENGQFQELKDGMMMPADKIYFGADFNDGEPSPVDVYIDGKIVDKDADFKIGLKPGNNLLGFWVKKSPTNGGAASYVDFQYFTVVLGGLTLKPATQEAWPGKTITFDLELTEAAPKGAKFEWWVDGVLKKSGYDFGIDVSFPDVGTHTIVAKMVDSAGKVLLQAQGTAVIKALTTTAFVGNNLTALQKMKTFTGVFQGQCNIKEQTGPVYFSVSMWDWYGGHSLLNITWSGASFSGTATSQVDGGTQTSSVSGTVSGDGKIFTSFTFTYSRKTNYTSGVYVVTQDNTIDVQLKNIPVPDLVWEGSSSSTCDVYKTGPEVKSYLVKYEQHFLTINSGRVTSESTYLSDTINWNGTGLQSIPTIGLHFK